MIFATTTAGGVDSSAVADQFIDYALWSSLLFVMNFVVITVVAYAFFKLKRVGPIKKHSLAVRHGRADTDMNLEFTPMGGSVFGSVMEESEDEEHKAANETANPAAGIGTASTTGEPRPRKTKSKERPLLAAGD